MREMEVLLGMEVNDTATRNHVTGTDIHKLLGQAMDHHVMTWFGAIMGPISFP